MAIPTLSSRDKCDTRHVLVRLHEEQSFHDRQAHARARFFRQFPERFQIGADEYLNHEPWIRPALAALGAVRGRRVLDFGCGHGMASVVLAGRGARVTAFDISGGYLEEARLRARQQGARVDFVKANGEYLPFADATFDGIWGNAVLHHLDIDRAGREIRRILRPDGVAVFCEPWGGNPLLNWARRYWPARSAKHTPDEAPLAWRDVEKLRAIFARVKLDGYQLLACAGRVLGCGRMAKALEWCDGKLLAALPYARRLCRYVVIQMTNA